MKKKNNIIGVLGDMHLKDDLSYADYVSDRRSAEKKEILDFVVKSFKDCQHIVFLGDNFHSKNNSSETNRAMVEFIERFGDKDIYIIAGNHETRGDGKTAIDFLKEIKHENWHILTDITMLKMGDKVVQFLPYMVNAKLSVENSNEAVDKILKIISDGEILFTHHAISGTSFNGIKTDSLSEIVLPRGELEKKYKLIVAGHIHAPQQYGKIVIAGSLFTADVGEKEKFIYKIREDLSVETIKVPAREIWKIENPTEGQLKKISDNSIVKVILTDRKVDAGNVLSELGRFDAHLLIEDYPSERKKMHVAEGAFDFSIEALLELYAKEKEVDLEKLKKGFALISN
jgi:DNA repair exonuclease SbcCD nuclease subunit